jgi:hypothetical protein
MPLQQHAPTTQAVEEAIMRVLAAEQAARAELQRCAAEAEEIRHDARRRARRIAERGAERVAAVHRSVDSSIRERIENLEGQRRELLREAAAGTDEPERLSRALDRLAADLGDGVE